MSAVAKAITAKTPLHRVKKCNRDLDEAAGAADAIACSGGGSLCGMRQALDCR
jgi:hypothetical protein